METLVLCAMAEAEAGPPPIIDLDSTIFLQWLLFAITALLLTRLLFRPFLAVRAERERGIDGAQAEAHELDEEAASRLTDYETRIARAHATAAKDRGAARAAAVAQEREITTGARDEAQRSLETARGALDTEAKAARTALQRGAEETGRAIVRKLLGREAA